MRPCSAWPTASSCGRCPVPRADQVVSVSATAPRASETFFLNNNRISYLDYVDLRDRAQTFAGLAAYTVTFASFATGRDQVAQSKLGLAVSGNFFDVLELQPALGRAIRPDEDRRARKRRRRRARVRHVDRAVRIRSGRHRAAGPTRWSRLHRRRRGAADVHRHASGPSAGVHHSHRHVVEARRRSARHACRNSAASATSRSAGG